MSPFADRRARLWHVISRDGRRIGAVTRGSGPAGPFPYVSWRDGSPIHRARWFDDAIGIFGAIDRAEPDELFSN